jgi:1-acyl-sn-glycerol-3-phosphate acyltransferase
MSEELNFEDGVYTTPPRNGWSLPRAFPSLAFYCQELAIILKATWTAKRGRYDTSAWVASSRDIMRALERVGVLFEITGVDHVRNLDRPAVFIGNHMSTLETFVLPGIVARFRETTFVVKQSLVDYPVFKHVMRSRDPVTVGRTNPRADLAAVLEGGERKLKAGVSMIVFPQSTRSTVFDPAEFNTIGVKLARRAGAPIVPVALKTDAWGHGRYLSDFGRIRPSSQVHFAFGEPMFVEDRGRETHEAIVQFISVKLAQWTT